MIDLHDEVSDAVDIVLRRYIDQRNERTGEHRRLLSVQVGKALVMLGCSYMGAAMGVGAEASLAPAKDVLDQFKAMVEDLRRRGQLPPV